MYKIRMCAILFQSFILPILLLFSCQDDKYVSITYELSDSTSVSKS